MALQGGLFFILFISLFISEYINLSLHLSFIHFLSPPCFSLVIPLLFSPPPLPSVLASFCSFLSFQDLHINLFLSPFFYHSFFLSFFSLLLSPSLLLSFPSYLTLAVPPTFPSFMPFHLSTSLCPPPPLGHLFCSFMCTTLPRSPPSPSLFPSYPYFIPYFLVSYVLFVSFFKHSLRCHPP